MEVVLDASWWWSDLQGEVTPMFPAIGGGSLDSID